MEKDQVTNTLEDTILLIRSFNCEKNDVNDVALQLSDILSRIPKGSIGEIYAQITMDGILKMGIRHNNDQFRLINILISSRIVGVTTCMMKDTLNRQVEASPHFSNMSEIATPYFEAVFGEAFEKEIVKRNNRLFECSLKFDDARFVGRTYISKRDQWIKRILGSKRHTSQHFRYLSFFKEYDYYVKNVFVENV